VARTTDDTLFSGRVALAQPARGEGYRVNVDALLLAHFACRVGRAKTAFDLGAGVGAVSLALLYWNAIERATLVEREPEAAELARANLHANDWDDRGEVIAGDVASVSRMRAGQARLVVCNPPYFAPGRGHIAGAEARARARSGELGIFVAAARTLLARRGRACFIYPARELASLLAALRESGLEPKRLRAVRATRLDVARVVLVEALAAKPGGLLVEPDLVERDGETYGEEVGQVISGARFDGNGRVVS